MPDPKLLILVILGIGIIIGVMIIVAFIADGIKTWKIGKRQATVRRAADTIEDLLSKARPDPPREAWVRMHREAQRIVNENKSRNTLEETQKLLKDIDEALKKPPVKLKTRFELLKG
jgi:hypothetical protein